MTWLEALVAIVNATTLTLSPVSMKARGLGVLVLGTVLVLIALTS